MDNTNDETINEAIRDRITQRSKTVILLKNVLLDKSKSKRNKQRKYNAIKSIVTDGSKV